MIVVGCAARIQLDCFAKQMDRRVILLPLETRASLLVVMLRPLCRRELRTTDICARYRLGAGRLNMRPRGSIRGTRLSVQRLEVAARGSLFIGRARHNHGR